MSQVIVRNDEKTQNEILLYMQLNGDRWFRDSELNHNYIAGRFETKYQLRKLLEALNAKGLISSRFLQRGHFRAWEWRAETKIDMQTYRKSLGE